MKELENEPMIKNIDCLIGMKEIEDNSIDCILTDPPYGYVKHKLDIPFNETEYFNQVKRILKDTGFIVLFGRGTAFYRWNTMLDNLNFKFLEEIIWEKQNISNPICNLGRIHETISIHTKKNGVIKKSKIPYLEKTTMKNTCFTKIETDLQRIISDLNNTEKLNELKTFIETNKLTFEKEYKAKHGITFNAKRKCSDKGTGTMNSIINGFNEHSIIRIPREHYKFTHPTQKPVRLLERLLLITTNKDDMVVDTFAGSGSTMLACNNLNRQFLGFEINKEFYEQAMINTSNQQQTLEILYEE
jgi:site-specific DNA-methyltransferase (adenine-specific)